MEKNINRWKAAMEGLGCWGECSCGAVTSFSGFIERATLDKLSDEQIELEMRREGQRRVK